MKVAIGDVLTYLARMLSYLPRRSITIIIKIVKFLRQDTKRLISLFLILGIVAISRYLVKRAALVRILEQ